MMHGIHLLVLRWHCYIMVEKSLSSVILFISIAWALFVTDSKQIELSDKFLWPLVYYATSQQVHTFVRLICTVLKANSTRSAVCNEWNAELHVGSRSWYLSRARCGGDCCVSLLAEYINMKEDCSKFSVGIAAYSLGAILSTTTKPSLSVKTRQHWSTLLALDIKLALLPWPLVNWY